MERYKNWEKGDKCPDCGSRDLIRTIIYENKVKSDKGKIYEKMNDNGYLYLMDDPVLKKFTCEKCGRTLLEIP